MLLPRDMEFELQFVVDANIFFAALIKNSTTLKLLLYSFNLLFTPEFVLQEFSKHKEEIIIKTRRDAAEFDTLFAYLRKRVFVAPKTYYCDTLKLAQAIAPDPDDAPYLALALKLGIPIWSNDKNLKEKQQYVNVYSTKDLLKPAT